MKTYIHAKEFGLAVVAFVGIAATGSLMAEDTTPAENHLVVHEWGTFTSVVGDDGVALDWRPLNGSSDLPKFVYEIGGLSSARGLRERLFRKDEVRAQVRMETPVVYFYAPQEMTVSLRVQFPKGRITEWYPQAKFVASTLIDWGQFKVMPTATAELPKENGGSHYYAARETDAAVVRVGRTDSESYEHEKFLFYRGVGTFELPLTVQLADGKVAMQAKGTDELGQVIVFENRAGKIGYRIQNVGKDRITVDRPATNQKIESLCSDLERLLVSQGLYEKEAKAMVKTWRDQWFEEGTRVFYVLPRAATDSILPITIKPQPKELVRVLVGRIEVITPEMEAVVEAQVRKLGDASFQTREAATRELKKHGRFAEPALKQILKKTNDPEIQARIKEVLRSVDVGPERGGNVLAQGEKS